MKKVLSIVLSVILLLTIVPVGTIGAGAEETDVIEIRTIAELYNINNNMSGNYKLMNDIDMTEDTAYGGDWDFMGYGWEPIGSDGTYSNIPFTGTFDGNGHQIIGMRIRYNTTPSETSTIYLGLFAKNEGTIKNLGIDETSKVCYGSSASWDKSSYYYGSICAYNSGTIINCYNKANISSTNYSGGICGYSQNGTLSNCYNAGDISSCSERKETDTYSGGICGKSTGGIISSCYNSGNIASNNSRNRSISSRPLAFQSTPISNAAVITNAFAGGICGSNGSTIGNCSNSGEISSIAESVIGGSSYIAYQTTKEYLIADSSVYCGGICGDSGNSITNCYNNGKLSAQSTSRANDYCYSSPKSQAGSYCITGGICGNMNGNIINCYNTAEIASSVDSRATYCQEGKTKDGEAKYYHYNGGIAGSSDTNRMIDSCYNTGTSLYGILGDNGTVSKCYYLRSSGDSNTGAKALSSAQLQLEICMPNFDFENTWVIDNTTDYQYPQLISNRQEKSTAVILGDVDGDNDVSIIDATCIQRHLASIPVSSYNEVAADADGDNTITIIDATWIQRYLVGLDVPTGIGNPI